MSRYYLELHDGRTGYQTGRVIELSFDGASDERDEVFIHAVIQEEILRLTPFLNKPKIKANLYRLPEEPTLTYTWKSEILYG